MSSADASAERAWQAMRTLVLDRYDRRAHVAAELGMSFVRVKALRRVARSATTMRDLAADLAIDAPYTTVVVDDLESRGLVERRPDAADRRRKVVAVTPAGARAARTAQRLLDVPPGALSGLPDTDLAELERILHAVLAVAPAAPAADA